MESKLKTELLEKLLAKEKSITKYSVKDIEFQDWKNSVERNFTKIYGTKSLELVQFKKLKFDITGPFIATSDLPQRRQNIFLRDLTVAKRLISELIEEIPKSEADEMPVNKMAKTQKIFISHSSNDKENVEELIDMLESIGLNSNQIFCTSFSGYGIAFGENFLERIKNELDNNVLVVFLLSESFYKSPVCLCEMGATWIKTNKHIPILIPPFDFKDIQGVIPLTQGFKINDKGALNEFKEQIENTFEIKEKLKSSNWERKRDRIVTRINDNIKVN